MVEKGSNLAAPLDGELALRSESGVEVTSAFDSKNAKSPKAVELDSKRKGPKKAKDGEKSKVTRDPPPNEPTTLPDFIIKRNELFEQLKRDYDAELLQKEKPMIDIALDLGLDKDGKPLPFTPVAAKAWESTPGSFLRHVPKEVSADVVVAKVDGKQLWDLDRPLEYSCRVSYLPFTSAEGRNVFWHSSAHVLGEAAECQYNCLLSHGPPVDQGFFYDMAIADGWGLSPMTLKRLLMIVTDRW